RISATTPIAVGKTEDDFPAAAYGPDGTLWVAYISYHLKDETRRIEQHPLKEQPANFKEFYTPEFGDQLFVKYYREGKWSEPIAITGANEDLMRCAIAIEQSGRIWVSFSAHRNGQFNVFVRSIDAQANPPRLGADEQLTSKPGSHVNPIMLTDEF